MNFSNLSQNEMTLQRKNNYDTTILTTPVPPCLQLNLEAKRVGVESLFIDMRNIPRFIPEVGTTTSASTFSYTPGSASDAVIQNDDFNPNVLNYFVTLRKKDNSEAVTAKVLWENINNVTVPSNYQQGTDVYSNPYYFSYNFMDFLSMVQQAINAAATYILGVAPANPSTLEYGAESKTFKLQYDVTTEATYDLEFSKSLLDLFNFEATAVNYGYKSGTNEIIQSYLIQWSDIETAPYLNAYCVISNNIYPFDMFILQCNLPINKTGFYSSLDKSDQQDGNRAVLFSWRRDFDAINMDTKQRIDNDGLINKLRVFEQNTFSQNYIEYKLVLRSRREQVFVEWLLHPNDRIEFTLNTYSLF